MKDLTDTICALSTPPGRSGIAVIRVSGSESFPYLRRIFSTTELLKSVPHRYAKLGRILDPRNGYEIDETVATCYRSPHSYTREDMVEFSIHGSPVLTVALLDCLCSLGARLAEPGEFTLRAFLNGRIDLTQAEAVHDIIDATTLYQTRLAGQQRAGALARQLQQVKETLIDIIVNMESAIEFVEEELPVASREKILGQLEELRNQLRKWIDSYKTGRIIKEGFSLAIIGRPNVGKSSVFNALLSQQRSIVTEVPGTTRDLVSESTDLGGVPVRLLDTAGIHTSMDRMEQFGMERSYEAIADTDAIIFVLDTSEPVSRQDLAIKQKLENLFCISVFNKSDLPSCWSSEEKISFADQWPSMTVSAKTGFGIKELREKVLNWIIGPDGIREEGFLITNLRHCHNLEAAEDDLAQAAAALQAGASEEFVLVDLHRGMKKLGEITGETHVEELLDEIFSRFCVGK